MFGTWNLGPKLEHRSHHNSCQIHGITFILVSIGVGGGGVLCTWFMVHEPILELSEKL